jgi:uncharacterized membrane protein YdjX (TVP38/TMEM64 family)
MNDGFRDERKANPWWVLLFTLAMILALMMFVSQDMDRIREFIGSSGWVGILVAVLVYAVLGASPIPSEPLTVLLSTVFGPFIATIASGVGNLLAALIEYYIGERISHAASFAERRARLPFGLGKVPVESPIFLMAARMIPGYGPKFVSVMGGIYRVPIVRYTWTAAIPTFAGSAIFAYGGLGLLHLGNLL